MNILKLVHDQQWFADGCVAAVSTGHQGSDNQLPDVEAFAAPRKCDRVLVRVQSAWNGQGYARNIAACTGQHSFRTRAGVQTIRPITLGSRDSGQPANTSKSNTRVHQSWPFRPPSPAPGIARAGAAGSGKSQRLAAWAPDHAGGPRRPRLAAAGPCGGSADCAGQTGCRVPGIDATAGSCPRRSGVHGGTLIRGYCLTGPLSRIRGTLSIRPGAV